MRERKGRENGEREAGGGRERIRIWIRIIERAKTIISSQPQPFELVSRSNIE